MTTPIARAATPSINVPATAIYPWTRPFIPEKLTPLRFTPSWEKLTDAERLRYNQLHGLYFHEQIIFFEQAIIVPLLRALQPLIDDNIFAADLHVFETEEHEHSAAFHRLLAYLKPEWYRERPEHFVDLAPTARRVLNFMLRRPRHFPFLIWLVQLLEERTMYASRLYLAEAGTFPGAIVSVQRKHLADEADHVQWDARLIDLWWARTPGWLRKLNVRLLDWMLREFIAVPRRAALRVIDALAVDCPTLSVSPATLKNELRGLADSPDFRAGVFGRDAVPRTWKQAETALDMAPFVQTWLIHEHTR